MVVHIRHRRVKRGGSQFYKSDNYSGELGTLCGAEMTDKDIPIESCMNKYFDPHKHEQNIKVKICNKCLIDAFHP